MEKNIEIRTFLKSLGIKPYINGYGHLIIAIDIVKKKFKRGLTNIGICNLYAEIAELSGTTQSRVERNIRHAIEVAWNENRDLMRELFDRTDRKPANGDFIATVAEYLYLKEEGDE